MLRQLSKQFQFVFLAIKRLVFWTKFQLAATAGEAVNFTTNILHPEKGKTNLHK